MVSKERKTELRELGWSVRPIPQPAFADLKWRVFTPEGNDVYSTWISEEDAWGFLDLYAQINPNG